MKILEEKKGKFEVSFSKDELKDVLTSTEIVLNGLPKKKELSDSRKRLEEIVGTIKSKLSKSSIIK